MAIVRPPLLDLEKGQRAFDRYQAEFSRLYLSAPIFDVMGRRVEFPDDACEHVCFKKPTGDPYKRGDRSVWSQERADRIPWIIVALTDPTTRIRPSHQTPGNQTYLITIPADPAYNLKQERYGVYVIPEAKDVVTFKTAYPMDERYWLDATNAGPRVYPPPEPKKKKRR